MKISVDNEYTLKLMEDIINIPSPVGSCENVYVRLEKHAKDLGYEMTYDRKGQNYITVEGEDNSKTVMISSHVDTLGMMVKKINPDGTLKVVQLGGISYISLEGETVTVHTRDNKEITGLMCCKSHSVHVFDDARTLERTEETMIIRLDEIVNTAEDVMALGIMTGDHISVEPRFKYTKSGFIKSRFIDDKACVANVFTMLKTLKELGKKPKYKTICVFTQYEEIGHGGSYVPSEVSEYLAVDIGLVGPDNAGTEFDVSICAKDAFSPYDKKFTTKMVNLAKKAELDYKVDIFYKYGTDAGPALRAGNNLVTAAIGPGTHSTHCMERTHIKAIENTTKLLVAYALDI